MRILDWSTLTRSPSLAEHRCRYGLLVEDVESEGFHCESYGFLVADDHTGEKNLCRHVTVNAAQAVELLENLARYHASPVNLQDVVEDWLGQ